MSDFTPTTEQVLSAAVATGYYDPDEVDRWHATELRKAKAEAFEEGLATIEDLIAVRDMVGFTPATINPYSGDRIEGE